MTLCSESEFSPVKNPIGAEKDSPDSARIMLSAQAAVWLKAAGCSVTEGPGQLEISPFVSYRGEGLERFNGLEIDGTHDVVLSVDAPMGELSLEQAKELVRKAKEAGKATLGDGGDSISKTK